MIAIFPELLGLAAAADIERMAVTVTTLFASEQAKAPLRGISFLDQLRERVGIQFHVVATCAFPCILASDIGGKFKVTMVANHTIHQLPTFTVAHLLGHYFMDLQLDISRGGRLQKGFKETVSPAQRYLQTDFMNRNSQETIADAFAAALIMPKDLLLSELGAGRSHIEIASALEVDPAWLKKRLQQLSIGQEQPLNFSAAEDLLKSKQKNGVQRFAASSQEPPQASPRKRGMERLREIASQLSQK